jgi:hypothetical protein
MFLNRLFRPARSRPTIAPRARATARLSLEPLDDRLVPARLSVGDATVVEGNTGTRTAAVVVRLDAPSTKTVSVNYSTAEGTAKAGNDYGVTSGTLTFARGETSKSILAPVIGDRLAEANETFFVNVRGAKGATIADGQGVVTIVDDETHIVLSGQDVWAPEGNSGTTAVTLTVSLSAACDTPVIVDYATANGSAIAGDDYLAASGTLTFMPGETTKSISVEVIGDTLAESTWQDWSSVPVAIERFYVSLSTESTNVLLSGNQLVVNIQDEEYNLPPPTGY